MLHVVNGPVQSTKQFANCSNQFPKMCSVYTCKSLLWSTVYPRISSYPNNHLEYDGTNGKSMLSLKQRRSPDRSAARPVVYGDMSVSASVLDCHNGVFVVVCVLLSSCCADNLPPDNYHLDWLRDLNVLNNTYLLIACHACSCCSITPSLIYEWWLSFYLYLLIRIMETIFGTAHV